MLQPRTAAARIAPYSQQLGDFFTSSSSVLVKLGEPIYSPAWGWLICWDKSRKISSNCLQAEPLARRSRAAAFETSARLLRKRARASLVRGRVLWLRLWSTFTAATISNHSIG